MSYFLLGMSPNLLLSFSYCASFSRKKKAARADFSFLNHSEKSQFIAEKSQKQECAVRNLSTFVSLKAVKTPILRSANNLYAEVTNPHLLFSNLKVAYIKPNLLVISQKQPNYLQPITEKSENSTIFDTQFSVPVVHQLPSLTNFTEKNSNLTNANSPQQEVFSNPVVHQLLSLTNFNGKNRILTSSVSAQKDTFSVPVVHQQNL
jgi:hypothetical protein